MYGDAGNDILYFSGFGDHYDGGSGTDTLSFQKQTTGVSFGEVDSPDTHTFEDAGGSLAVEKVLGSQYADHIDMGGGIIDGAGGNDSLGATGGDGTGRLYGGAGNDWLHFDGQEGAGLTTGYGGSGNDTLDLHDMTGGSGKDTFILDYNVDIFPGNGGAIVRDFTHGYDHITFQGTQPGTLEHDAGSDIWTVHSVDHVGDPYDTSFEIAGITSLSPSEYDFHLG